MPIPYEENSSKFNTKNLCPLSHHLPANQVELRCCQINNSSSTKILKNVARANQGEHWGPARGLLYFSAAIQGWLFSVDRKWGLWPVMLCWNPGILSPFILAIVYVWPSSLQNWHESQEKGWGASCHALSSYSSLGLQVGANTEISDLKLMFACHSLTV